MSHLSPAKHKTLSRQPSSPSLAVGIPPALPENNLMSSPSKARVRPERVHRGDVESSPESSDENEWVLPTTPSASLSVSNTPKRKVVNMVEGVPATSRKRDTLQARLQQAARVKKSKSAGDGLSMSLSNSSISALASSSSGFLPLGAGFKERILSGSKDKASDKVIVCVRIKPTRSAFATMAYDVTPRSLSLSNAHPNVLKRGGKAGREEEYLYNFDALLQYPSRTPELYSDKVANLVDKAMNGFNSTIFAYGATGSGKSFTMTGIPTELGVIPCAIDGVFDAITADPERAFLLRVSYLEIYNETLRDLLNPPEDQTKPVIRSSSQGKVWVDRLVEEVVSTPQEVIDILEKGNENRKVGATDWNERSSRSHSVFTIVIESRPRDGNGDDDVRVSRLNLIDLAGSEKAVSDLERRGEGKHINQSLLALREVINKLTEKKKAAHVPYRNSKLTHLLENALGGDSNICVICTISVEEEHTSETLETLKFAGRCSQVETKAKKNILMSSDKALIRAKDQEIEELKRKLLLLANQRSDPGPSSQELVDSVADLEARKAKLTSQLARLNGEILTSELPRVGSMNPLPISRPKRRRISDFANLMGGGRLGMGSPRMQISDRRAVSGMARLGEDEMPSLAGIVEGKVSNSFDNETIAALRRQIEEKDQELAALKASPGDDSALRDSHVQLEATRVELVRTVDEKSARIDELENTILDLRSSREELVVEDEHRLADMRKELEYAREQLESERKDKEEASEQLTKARDEMDEFQRKVMQNSSHQDLRAELAKLREEADKAKAENTKLAERYSKEVLEKEEMRVSMESERRRAKAAERGLLQVQFPSMTNDIASQQTRLDNDLQRRFDEANRERQELRQALDAARSQTSNKDLEAQLQASKDATAALETQVAELKSAHAAQHGVTAELDDLKRKHAEVEGRSSGLAKELEEIKQRHADLEGSRSGLEKQLEEQKAALQAEQEASKTAQESADRLAVELNEIKQRQIDLESARLALERELNELKQRHADQEGSRSGLQQELDEIKQKHADLEGARSGLEKELEEQKALALGVAAAEARASSAEETVVALQQEVASLKSGSAEAATLTADLETAKSSLAEASRMLAVSEEHAKSLESDATFLRADKASLTEQLETLRTELSSSSDVGRQLVEAQESSRQHADRSAELQTSVDSLKKEIQELQDTMSGLPTKAEMDLLKTALDAAQEALGTANEETASIMKERTRLADNVEALEVQVASLKALATTGDEAAKALEASRTELAAAQTTLETVSNEKDEASRRVEALEAEIKRVTDAAAEKAALLKSLEEQRGVDAMLQQERDAATAKIASLEDSIASSQSDLQQAKESTATLLQERDAAVAKVESLEETISTSNADLEQAKESVAALLRERETATAKIASLEDSIASSQAAVQQSNQAVSADLQTLQDKLDSLQASTVPLPDFEQIKKALKETGEALETERARAQDLVNKQESLVAEHRKAISTRSTADADELQAALATAKKEVTEARDQQLNLTAQLADAENALAKLKAAKSALPTASEVTQLKAQLSAAQSSATKAQSTAAKESAEVERLELVIEEQKIMIDAQREKILYWQRQLELQGEVVRKLTEGAPLPPSPTASPGSRHTKSKSLALPSSHELPTPATPKKLGLPSTFTAHNLAFASSSLTLAKPKPLPSHPSQWSNTTSKKGRRVTIEHDIDLLSDSSRVLQAKKIFDSPGTKVDMPAPASIKQRKA